MSKKHYRVIGVVSNISNMCRMQGVQHAHVCLQLRLRSSFACGRDGGAQRAARSAQRERCDSRR